MSKLSYFVTPVLICIYIFSTGHKSLKYDPGFKVDNFTSASITSFTVEDNDEFNTLTDILPNQSAWVELVTNPSGPITITIQFPPTRPSGRIRIRNASSNIIYCGNIPAGNNIVGYVFEWTDVSPSLGYRVEYEALNC